MEADAVLGEVAASGSVGAPVVAVLVKGVQDPDSPDLADWP